MNYKNDRTGRLNNVACVENLATSSTTFTYSVTIGGFNLAGAVRSRPIKIKRAIFTRGTTIEKYYIPVYRMSDGEIGLLDVVNNVFKTNAGSTGSFTKGPDIKVGKAKLVKIEGNSVVENQSIDPVNTYLANSNPDIYTLTRDNDNRTIILDCYAAGTAQNKISCTRPILNGHKYIVMFDILSTMSFTMAADQNVFNGTYLFGTSTSIVANKKERVVQCYAATFSSNIDWRLARGSTTWAIGDKITFSNIQFIDITLMFGTDNEPTSLTDNRIQAIINRGYIAYNTGEIKDSKIEKIVVEEYNIWDEEWELGTISTVDGQNSTANNIIRTKNYVKVTPNKAYTMNYSGSINNYTLVWAFCYDENKQLVQQPAGASTSNKAFAFIFGTSFVMPQNCHYIRWYFRAEYGTTYDNDLCLHLTSQRTGYAPHKSSNVISLPNTLQLAGAISAHNTFAITDSGYVFTRNVWKVDMGDLAWREPDNTGRTYQYGSPTFTYAPHTNDNNAKVLLCTKYGMGALGTDKAITWYNNNVFVADSGFIGKTAAETRTALTGTYLQYPLATPQTITIPRGYMGCYVFTGTETISSWRNATGNYGYLLVLNSNFAAKPNSGSDAIPNLYMNDFIVDTYGNSFNQNSSNCISMVPNDATSGNRICIRSSSISTTTDMLAYLNGKQLFYETSAPVINVTSTAKAEQGGSVMAYQFGWVENQIINTTIEQEIVLASDDTSSASWWKYPSIIWDIYSQNAMVSGHKYFGLMNTNLPSGVVSIKNASNAGLITDLFTWTSGTISHCAIWKNTTATIPAGTYKISYQLIDLTLAFGAGNEPTNINDSRIQYIINKGYIPYNTGTQAYAEPEVLANVVMKVS